MVAGGVGGDGSGMVVVGNQADRVFTIGWLGWYGGVPM